MAESGILIHCATSFEFQAIERALKQAQGSAHASRIAFFRGGMGRKKAAQGLEWKLGTLGAEALPELVVDFGAAGALVPSLKLGDLVVASELVEPEGDKGKTTVFRVPERLVPRSEWVTGRLACVDGPVASVGERQALAEQCGAVAVCFEAMTLARICSARGLGFASFRVITDLGGASPAQVLAEHHAEAPLVLARAADALVRALQE